MSRTIPGANLKPAFPTFSLDKGGKGCMDTSWQSNVSPAAALEPSIDVYNTGSNNRYFKNAVIEIAIIVRCISLNNPKLSYYIADHAQKTVRWLGGDTPKCYNVNVDVRMRDCAEYWHHRSKFPVHRHCTPEDRAEVAAVLDGMLDRSENNPELDRGEIEQYIRKLDNIPSSPPLTNHETSTLAKR
ncbi:unnamed protein product [Rhizoctonia solani]|uniref:Uncharacterized protein n=1 Tax=Rhizoctonia solani TaxID=456999 RepID=A0A8H2WAU9_9AGAM|nr:unnamed protein product [Rhizoctonia solani]